MIRIYYAYTDILQSKSPDDLAEQLPLAIGSKLRKLKREEDKQLLLLSMVLLTKALCDNAYDNFSLRDLQYSKTGKPFFPGVPFDFNISHTENCAAVVFSDEGRVGIDVEKIKVIDFSDFSDYFTTEQWEDIYNSDDSLKRFYYYWTLIESGVKADGRGLSLISTCSITLTNNTLIIDKAKWYYKHCHFDQSISCCITTDINNAPLEIINITSI